MESTFTSETAGLILSIFTLILVFIIGALVIYLVIRGSTHTTTTKLEPISLPGKSFSNIRLASTSSGGIRKFLVVAPGISALSTCLIPTNYNYDSGDSSLSVAGSNKYVGVDKDGSLILTDTPSQKFIMRESGDGKFQLISENGSMLVYDPKATGTCTSKVTLSKESAAPAVVFESIDKQI